MLKALNPIPVKVPRRLSSETVRLAQRYLDGEFKDTVTRAGFCLPETAVSGLSDNMKYGLTVKLIGENAPLRILPEELLVGAATLLEAAEHHTPACSYSSTSHVTIGFNQVLQSGYRGLRERVGQRLTDDRLAASQRDFLQAMLACLEGAQLWHKRQLAELDRLAAESSGNQRQHYADVRRFMTRVPELPPETFREAVQSLWLLFSFQRLCGNWSGLGRLDQMLGPYLKHDLQNGTITIDEARELLAHFWIKGTEWCKVFEHPYGGDAQYYQNVIIGGIDCDGNEVTNEVTYLILDVVEELHISDYPVAVRVSERTPDKLLRRIAEVQRCGGGIVSIYNEDLVIRALIKFGFPEADAREFTNDGCWEVIIGGKSAFIYIPFDALLLLQRTLGVETSEALPDFASFEALYQDFLTGLRRQCRENDQAAAGAFQGDIVPTPLLSLFVDDCIELARGYNNRGAKYNIAAIHAGGLPDVANSLYVIKKLIFDEHKMTLPELVLILRDNWAGQEPLRQRINRDYPLYGNDASEADAVFSRLVDDYARIAGETHEISGILRPVGISTFGREISYAPERKATAFGRKAGEILATNLAPTPGSDYSGPTAVIKSFCQVDFSKIANGCPLELKLHPVTVKGEDGILAMVSLLRTFVALGGFYLQADVVDSEVLRDAQLHPDKYPNLAVRISGWSARFDTLDRTWQDMIINRTQQRL